VAEKWHHCRNPPLLLKHAKPRALIRRHPGRGQGYKFQTDRWLEEPARLFRREQFSYLFGFKSGPKNCGKNYFQRSFCHVRYFLFWSKLFGSALATPSIHVQGCGSFE
jgi:hypothetical protein